MKVLVACEESQSVRNLEVGRLTELQMQWRNSGGITMKYTETENIIDAAFNDAGIALTIIYENVDDDRIAAKIRKMRDDLHKIITAR